MGWKNDCFTRYIMLGTTFSLKHTRACAHTHTHTHSFGCPPFLFLRYLLSIYIFKIYVMYMYSIWKQIGNLQWSLSSSTYTARKHIHRSNLEGHIERGREGEREREEEEVWQKRKGANHVEYPDRHGETIHLQKLEKSSLFQRMEKQIGKIRER